VQIFVGSIIDIFVRNFINTFGTSIAGYALIILVAAGIFFSAMHCFA